MNFKGASDHINHVALRVIAISKAALFNKGLTSSKDESKKRKRKKKAKTTDYNDFVRDSWNTVN